MKKAPLDTVFICTESCFQWYYITSISSTYQ